MSNHRSDSGQVPALIFAGLVLLSISAGITVTHALTTHPTAAQTAPTPPSLVNLTGTPTAPSGGTSTPTDGLLDTPTRTTNPGDGTQTLVVDETSDVGTADCPDAEHTSIQSAVRAAEPGDTVRVCTGTYTESVAVATPNVTIVADGAAVIASLQDSTVRITAANVTLHGFDIQAREAAPFAVEVGGAHAIVRNNSVESAGIGIFLSDGKTGTGEPDTVLDSATGSHVANNTVAADEWRIWADADRAVLRMNEVSDRPPGEVDSVNHSIVSSGNGIVIANNSVRYTYHAYRLTGGSSIAVGLLANTSEEPRRILGAADYGAPGKGGHNAARENVVSNNTVVSNPSYGIRLLTTADGAVLRNNNVTASDFFGVVSLADRTVVRNNTVFNNFLGVMIVGHETLVVENNITFNGEGIDVHGQATVARNELRRNDFCGVDFRSAYYPSPGKGRVVNNRITGNAACGVEADTNESVAILSNRISGNGQASYFGGDGILLAVADRASGKANATNIEIHRNVIVNNAELGINNQNVDKSDGEWPVVNATNNVWACGGPSGGLADPYTGRVANGSGDEISAGDEPGVSNVHFDPFQVLASCPGAGSGPTATPSPTATPTFTPTPTSTSRPPPTQNPAFDGGTAGPTSTVDGGGTGDGPSGGKSRRDGQTGDGAVTPIITPTRTPTVSPTLAGTPTPQVEPGFGVVAWVLGCVVLLGRLGLRMRSSSSRGEDS